MTSAPITNIHRRRIARFIDTLLDSPYHQPVQAVLDEATSEVARKLPGCCPMNALWLAPSEMLSGPPDDNGQALWRPVDSPIDEAMAASFERFLGRPLPPLFKAYLTQKCLLGMDLFEGTLPDIDPRRPLEWLEWSALSSRAFRTSPRLIPFTDGPARLCVLCFDARDTRPDGDYPIVLVEPEGGRTSRDGREVFASFAAYLDFLEDWLRYKTIAPPVYFLDWLRQHGREGPPSDYYAPPTDSR